MLRAFLDDATLGVVNAGLETQGYRTHEFGDSVLIERKDRTAKDAPAAGDRVATAA